MEKNLKGIHENPWYGVKNDHTTMITPKIIKPIEKLLKTAESNEKDEARITKGD